MSPGQDLAIALGLDALHLAHPAWIHGLWLAGLLALGLALLERRGGAELRRLVSERLAARLVERPARWRRRARIVLFAVSLIAMAGALVRPQWGEQFVATPRVGAEIMIALDVSRSMLADDARPSRLERAKAEVADLLGYLEHDQVGLIAFAGRASILSPLTPDRSFLRLALEGAGPHSVSRGGTSLAEPILRAVAGLGEPGPAQRALILITDGEDHDAFAVDAARRAAAAGIKIITIGFGDEAGSPIFVVDPNDGSHTQVRDADGNPVVSRLNGELLREIALATDGAYVPAGTGVLDLASIYESHIARLTRGQLEAKGRSVRGETYPVFVGVALLALVAGIGLGQGHSDHRRRLVPAERAPGAAGPATSASPSIAWILLPLALSLAVWPMSVRAADPDSTAGAPAPAPGAPSAESLVDLDPRVRFNRGNERLSAGAAAEASALYREARREATDDLELRHAASYNLGMAAVAQADALEPKRPKEALAFLHEAADWFREAAAMRPDEEASRHNLDVTLRRAAILADAIARQEEGGLETQLDRLIDARRARVAEAAGLLEIVAQQDVSDVSDPLASACDRLATSERESIADAESFGDRVADEKAIVELRPEAERSPEDRLRAASLEGVLAYLDQGIERMGQTRRQLRQRSAERAYRRSSEALALLKRARDQLRDPVEQLGVLVAEVGGVAQATGILARSDGGAADRAGVAARGAARLPAFLTRESVEAETASVEARVGELAERFEGAAREVRDAGSSGTGADPAGAAGESDPGSARLRAALGQAAPLVRRADSAMERAVASMADAQLAEARTAEEEAIAALAEAQELFFDLRELLAAAQETEARIAAVAAADSSEALALRTRESAALAEAQTRNRKRADRLDELLAAELAAERAAASGGDAPSDGAPSRSMLESRHVRAEALLAEAKTAMSAAGELLNGSSAPGRSIDWPRVAERASLASERLESLRLLFLSLLERLQRLEREQVDLSDRTRDAIALGGADAKPTRSGETQARVGAAAADQAALEQEAGTIADALLAQSDSAARAQAHAGAADAAEAAAPGAAQSGAADQATSGTAGPDADTLRRAADHVATAQLSMQEAVAIFEDAAKTLSPAEQVQTIARDELRRAIALLSPPPDEPPSDPQEPSEDDAEQQPEETEKNDAGERGAQDEPQDPEQGEEASEPDQGEGEPRPGSEAPHDDPASGGGGAEGVEASEDPGADPGDPAQILQGVRDREAARRESNERRARERRRAPGVEKDW